MSKRIMVGNVPVGGGAPVSIQSMCSTKTHDVEATVEQILRLEEAGCEIIRVAVPDMAAAKAVGPIRSRIHIPLVTDIHFDYKLALECAAQGADKIRINPGNIGGEDRVKAVADTCRAGNIPIRIGVNGGSLEPELRKKYGVSELSQGCSCRYCVKSMSAVSAKLPQGLLAKASASSSAVEISVSSS